MSGDDIVGLCVQPERGASIARERQTAETFGAGVVRPDPPAVDPVAKPT